MVVVTECLAVPIVAANKLPGKTFYQNVQKVFGESILPQEVSVGVKLLRISMDLTDLVRSVWTDEDLDQEFDRRLRNTATEYREVEGQVLTLDAVQSKAYSIECARLCTQLREIGGEALSEGSEDSAEEKCSLALSEEESEEEEDDEERYLEERLVRKVLPGHQDGGVYRDKCLECEKTLDMCTCDEACRAE